MDHKMRYTERAGVATCSCGDWMFYSTQRKLTKDDCQRQHDCHSVIHFEEARHV